MKVLLTGALMSAIGIGPIPIDAFVRTKPPRFLATGSTPGKASAFFGTSDEASTTNWQT